MRVVGGDLYPVDVSVTLWVLKRYKAFGGIFMSAVAPKVVVAVRASKKSYRVGVVYV